MRFNILGALEGWHGERRLRLGSPTQERVLATLLLEPGRMVPMTRLVAAAWDDEPPQTAGHQIRKAVAALRTRIPGGSSLIVTDGAGYRAVLTDEQLDLHEFTRRSQEARQAVAAGQSAEAVGHLRACLDLWRGPVMAGTGGAVISAASAALEERHMAVAEQYFELQLELGQSGELIGPLRELITAHPLRETLRGRLMVALYRAGRQAEALEEFGRVRELLVEELGIDPGAELTRLYEAILRDSPEVAPRVPQSVADRAALLVPAPLDPPSASDPAPCTLPYDLPDFTGRDTELARLLEVGRAPAGRSTRIVGVDGMGGSGKTALAVHAAHLLAPDYPDGQLFVDLRGFSPGEKAQEPSAVLHSLLRTLGVPDDRIPDDLERRTTLWRTVSAQRRLLLLLDNAADVAQVRPLLPASEDCLAILTGRVRMLELDGAEWLSLGLLSADDSITLLTRTLGVDRTTAEPQAVDQLARLCCGLPLALRITTARLRNRPRWTVQYLVDRLADETRRLRELSAGERSVEATLRLSYQGMEEDQRVAFRLLGLHPGSAIDVHSAAALLGADVHDTEDLLELLLDNHLLEQHEAGLYGFHDLVRTYAMGVREPEDDEEGAVERLVSYYTLATDQACEILFPGRNRYSDPPEPSSAELPRLDGDGQALRWFDREHEALLAVATRAGTQGLHRTAALLARNVLFYLHLRGHYEEFRGVNTVAVSACRQLDDPVLLSLSLCNLAVGQWWLGNFHDGISTAQEALELVGSSDRRTEGFCIEVLGLLHGALGNFDEARFHLVRGIALHRDLGAHRQEAEALVNLSSVQTWTGHYAEGVRYAARATELNRRLGERSNEISSLSWLALAHLGTGEDERARACLSQALELCDDSRQPGNVAFVLAHWARVCQRLGEVSSAAEYAERALDLVSAGGTVLRQAAVVNVVGLVHLCADAPDRAMELYRRAHELASRLGYRIEIARALHGMAEAARVLGDEPTARRHQREADVLYDVMGVTEAGRRL
ncbi:DNA-binding SARP family transcriptional activator [Streptomyces griseochromogenes]|uniref:DNA-binding SARP family transcriptional activator n=1 Tax=Streptomyces griseochromogenes TaxID=68214 RepID=A0ABS4M312_9ACTN|nr:BTAD domain-containing putative transcriptional regulator [Streptomyces griseochromogenes]MBP2054069.1 DNA-binding SARP family transcriptional activator [Streptomyces griseochromogenes]